VYVAELLAAIKCTLCFDGIIVHYLENDRWMLHCCGVMLQGSVVEVQWEGNHQKNVYRLGHKGKVCIGLVKLACFSGAYWSSKASIHSFMNCVTFLPHEN
jgi:hypothetical protein